MPFCTAVGVGLVLPGMTRFLRLPDLLSSVLAGSLGP